MEPAAFKRATAHLRPPIWVMHLPVDGAWTLAGTYRHDTGFGLAVTIERVLGDAPFLSVALTCQRLDQPHSPVMPLAEATLPDPGDLVSMRAALAHCDSVLIPWEVETIFNFDPDQYRQFEADHAVAYAAEAAVQDADFPDEDDGWEDDWDCDVDWFAAEFQRDDVDLWEGQTAADLTKEDPGRDQVDVFDALTAAITAVADHESAAPVVCREVRHALVRLAVVVGDTVATPAERADLDREVMALADRLVHIEQRATID